LGITVFCTTLPLVAQAYVGPGAGLGLLTALWGLVAAVGVAVFYVLMWPIRRLRRRRRAERTAAATAETPVMPMGDPVPAPRHEANSNAESIRH
jgi:peptidoglycan/LPS O-acetylase OafA/YrhL